METKQLEDALKSIQNEVDSFIKSTNESVSANDEMTKEQKAKISEMSEKAEAFDAKLSELEQKLAGSADEEVKSLTAGEQFIKSDAFSSFLSGSQSKAVIEVKNTVGTGDNTTFSDRLAGVNGPLLEPLNIEAVLPSGNISTGSIEYIRESIYGNNAAETAEKAVKPESDISFTQDSTSVKTVAHTIKVTRQLLDDSQAIAAYINTRMAWGVQKRVNDQLIIGDGVGANLAGLSHTSNHTAFTPTSGDSAEVSLRKAMNQAELAFATPSVVILNPTDAMNLDLLKDSTGAYFGNIRFAATQNIWGLPIITSAVVPAGTFFVMDPSHAMVWNRHNTRIEMFDQDADNVSKNLLTIRAERALALTVFRPEAIISGSLVSGSLD